MVGQVLRGRERVAQPQPGETMLVSAAASAEVQDEAEARVASARSAMLAAEQNASAAEADEETVLRSVNNVPPAHAGSPGMVRAGPCRASDQRVGTRSESLRSSARATDSR